MIRIKQRITSTGVQPAQPSERMSEHTERPKALSGTTYKTKTPLAEEAFYVTINDIVLNEGTEHETRVPFEIFINSKNMEHFQWIVALTRIISSVFRKGGDVTFLIEELRSVFDPRGGYFQGKRYIPSIVAAIGDVIATHMDEIGLIGDTRPPPAPSGQGAPCPKCSAPALVHAEGCATCTSCGYSRCE